MAEIKAGGSRKRIIAIAAAIVVIAAGVFISTSKGGLNKNALYFVTHAEKLNHLDPQRIYTGQDIAFMDSYVFRTLVSYNPTSGPDSTKLVPDLATDIGTATDGGKTWAWTLKSGIKWEDGTPLVCEDVKYGISRIFATDVIVDGPTYALSLLDIPKDAKGNSAYAGPYKKTGQDLYDKAVVCNGNTITMHLNTPVGDFNYFATYPAVAPVKASADTGDKYDLKPMGTGPYKIASFKAGGELHLVLNPNWDQTTDTIRKVNVPEIYLRFGLSEDVRDQIFLKDSQPNAFNYDQGLQTANNQVYYTDPKYASRGMNEVSPFVRYYAVNVAKGHLDCLEVRKAVFFAINGQGIIDLNGGTKLYGEISDNTISKTLATDYAPTTGNIHDPQFKPSGNPTYAKMLLDQAKTACPATYAKATDPAQGITFDFSNVEANKKASAIIKSSMDAAGIVSKFNFIEAGAYYPTVMNPTKQNDISTSGWAADWANASTVIPPLFLKDGGFNLNQNWNEPSYAGFKARVTAAQGETNRAKQATEWKSLSQFAMDQYWVIKTVGVKEQFQWGSRVTGAEFWMPQGSPLYVNLGLSK